MHPFHQILFDIVKCNTLGGAVVHTPFDIHTVVRVPIIFGIFGGRVRQVMPWLEWHVAFPSGFILGVIRYYVHLTRQCVRTRDKNTCLCRNARLTFLKVVATITSSENVCMCGKYLGNPSTTSVFRAALFMVYPDPPELNIRSRFPPSAKRLPRKSGVCVVSVPSGKTCPPLDASRISSLSRYRRRFSTMRYRSSPPMWK